MNQIDPEPLIAFGDWTVITSPEKLNQYRRQHNLVDHIESPSIKSFPCLVQHVVHGSCDDCCAWFVITREDAKAMAELLTAAERLFALLARRPDKEGGQ